MARGPIVNDETSMVDHEAHVSWLIDRGYLPRAEGLTTGQRLRWDYETLSRIFGVSISKLSRILMSQPPRFLDKRRIQRKGEQ